MGWWCSGVHQTLGTGGVTILMVSVNWWCSGIKVRLLVLVVLPYLWSVWLGGVLEYMSESWY